MKLLVLGSSNAIGPYSFVDHLGRVPGFEITNRSIGASTSTAGIYALLAEDSSAFDYVLIDYEINEEGALQERLRTVEEASLSLRSLIFALRARDCTPLLTIVPTTHGRDRPSGAEKLYRKICREESVHVMSIADFYRRAFRRGGAWDRMLRDPFHMAVETTPIVAEAFARAFRVLEAVRATPREWTSRVVPMRAIPAADLVASDRRVRRASSHRSAWHAVLRRGDRLSIPVGSGERLVGLAINCGAPGAKVAFVANGARVVKRLVIYFDQARLDKFISVLVDLNQAMPGGPGGIDLEVLPANAEETERTLHQQSIVEGRYGEIEIEGFVIAASTPVLSRCIGVARPGVPCDLGGVIDSEDLVARLATLGARASLG
ncbi:MAG: hypothetical protein HY271_11350 [Deltaproteobacteria bacterium]|nr:hypothetical protein [Deltaproteobacteria bacterium]